MRKIALAVLFIITSFTLIACGGKSIVQIKNFNYSSEINEIVYKGKAYISIEFDAYTTKYDADSSSVEFKLEISNSDVMDADIYDATTGNTTKIYFKNSDDENSVQATATTLIPEKNETKTIKITFELQASQIGDCLVSFEFLDTSGMDIKGESDGFSKKIKVIADTLATPNVTHSFGQLTIKNDSKAVSYFILVDYVLFSFEGYVTPSDSTFTYIFLNELGNYADNLNHTIYVTAISSDASYENSASTVIEVVI